MTTLTEYEYSILDGTTSGGLQPVVGTINTVFLSDEAQSTRAVDFNILSPSGAVVGRMLVTGGPIRQDARFYYHKDLLGSTRAVVTDQGKVAEQAAFDPWGVVA